ncbi:hypothetical protein [Morganella morganii]|uniref:hypothetical protein n=1 Tax=Morganella TaxID=581 RepID=UPI00370C589C
MSFHIRNKFLSAEISHSQINAIARSDTPPEVSLWEKIKALFCLTNKPEALTLIRQICHPPDGTTWDTVTEKFERLKTLAYDGFKERIQVGRDGENHACILDENGDEMLSATFDKDIGKCTVKCQESTKTDHLNPTGVWEAELAISAEDASETLWTDHSVTAAPQTAQGYEATWSAWEKAAPTGEAFSRAAAVQKMRNCLYNDKTELKLEDLKLTSLPDYLPPDITVLNTTDVPLNYLPELPAGLQTLLCSGNQLVHLPVLPAGLQTLWCGRNRLTCLPVLPAGLQELGCKNNHLTRLPPLPAGLQELWCGHNWLTCLPVLPAGLQKLVCDHNHLTSLPTLPAGLDLLMCNLNRLTRRPENITALSRTAYINISDNPISESESRTPDTMPRTPYPAPRAPRPVPAPRALYPVPAPRPHTPDDSEPAIYFNNK